MNSDPLDSGFKQNLGNVRLLVEGCLPAPEPDPIGVGDNSGGATQPLRARTFQWGRHRQLIGGVSLLGIPGRYIDSDVFAGQLLGDVSASGAEGAGHYCRVRVGQVRILLSNSMPDCQS